jgi:hypothetical protein
MHNIRSRANQTRSNTRESPSLVGSVLRVLNFIACLFMKMSSGCIEYLVDRLFELKLIINLYTLLNRNFIVPVVSDDDSRSTEIQVLYIENEKTT